MAKTIKNDYPLIPISKISLALQNERLHSGYIIGYDSTNDRSAYCIGRHYGDKFEVIFAKQKDHKGDGFAKDEFEKEVKNLAEYFGAKIIKEKSEL